MEHQDHAECAENAERVEHVECLEYTGVQRSAVGRRRVPRSTVETVKNLKYAVYVKRFPLFWPATQEVLGTVCADLPSSSGLTPWKKPSQTW